MIGRGAGDDAIEVFGIALGFHEGFAAAIGAADEVAAGNVLAVEGADDGFGLGGGFLEGAVAEVDEFFGVADGPGGAGLRFVVAVVGAGGGIAAAESREERAGGDGARPAAVADLLILAVPAFVGQPDFDFDVGVRGGPRGNFYFTARGGGGDGLGGGDGGMVQLELQQLFAVRLSGEDGGEQKKPFSHRQTLYNGLAFCAGRPLTSGGLAGETAGLASGQGRAQELQFG